MSYKGFEEVFAPSSTTVEAKRDSHLKKVKSLIVVDTLLALGLVFCFFLLFRDYGDIVAKEVVDRMLLGGILILLASLAICVTATGWHFSKAIHFDQELKNGYILSGAYSRNEFYY